MQPLIVSPIIIMAFLLFAAVPIFPQKYYSASSKKSEPTLSIDEIDMQIAAIERRISVLNDSLTQLRRDSLTIISEALKRDSILNIRNRKLDSLLKIKEVELMEAKSRLSKARNDSVSTIAFQQDTIMAVQKELAAVKSRLLATQNELNMMQQRRNQLLIDKGQANNISIEKIRSDLQRNTAQVSTLNSELNQLKSQISQLKSDSLSVEVKLNEIRKNSRLQIRRLDSLLYLNNVALAELTTKRQESNRTHESIMTMQKQKLSLLTVQKKQLEQQIALLNQQISKLQLERNNLSSASAKTHASYEQQRAPYAAAVASCEHALSQRSNLQEILRQLRNKTIIDTAIAGVQNQLDELIQLSASGKKKNIKKQIEEKENMLGHLIGQREEFRRQPAVIQKESEFSAMTARQRLQAIDSIMSLLGSELLSLADQCERARNKLNLLELSSPLRNDPSVRKVAKIDSTINSVQTQIISLTKQKDSLDSHIAHGQKTLNDHSVSVQSEKNVIDGKESQLRQTKLELTAQLTKAKNDSIQNESTVSAELSSIKKQIISTQSRISAINNELSSLAFSIEALKQNLLQAEEKNTQTILAVEKEKRMLDSLCKIKEQAIILLNAEHEKLLQLIKNIELNNTKAIQAISSAIISLSNATQEKEAEKAGLLSQLDAIISEKKSADSKTSANIKTISAAMFNISSLLQSAKLEIASLKTKRTLAIEKLKEEITKIEGSIELTKRTISALESNRNKARQDSLAAEKSKAENALRVKAKLFQHDSATSALQKQLMLVTGQYEKLRNDSISLVSKNRLSLVPLQASVQRLDTLIALKEKELLELKAQRELAKQEIIAEQKRQSSAIDGIHSIILAQKRTVDELTKEIVSMTTKRSAIQHDSLEIQNINSISVKTAAAEISKNDSMIASHQKQLANLQAQKESVQLKLKAIHSHVADDYSRSSTHVSNQTPAANKEEMANKILEQIYFYFSDGKLRDGLELYNSQKEMLAKNLNQEAFKILQTTVNEFLKQTNKK